jgi:hypothetical protein
VLKFTKTQDQKSEMIDVRSSIVHAEKMERGQIEVTRVRLLRIRKADWKDEFILLVLSAPIVFTCVGRVL